MYWCVSRSKAVVFFISADSSRSSSHVASKKAYGLKFNKTDHMSLIEVLPNDQSAAQQFFRESSSTLESTFFFLRMRVWKEMVTVSDKTVVRERIGPSICFDVATEHQEWTMTNSALIRNLQGYWECRALRALLGGFFEFGQHLVRPNIIVKKWWAMIFLRRFGCMGPEASPSWHRPCSVPEASKTNCQDVSGEKHGRGILDWIPPNHGVNPFRTVPKTLHTHYIYMW